MVSRVMTRSRSRKLSGSYLPSPGTTRRPKTEIWCLSRQRRRPCVAAMTPTVKDELSRLPVGKACCRRAEMAVILRFAGGLHLANGRVVVEAELDTASVARRLRQEIAEVFGHP